MTLDVKDATSVRAAEAAWRAGRSGVQPLVDVVGTLVSGNVVASPAIAEFLTLPDKPDGRDVRELVDGVLSDLGLHPLSTDDAIRVVVAGIAAQVVAGDIAPETGADEIWRASAPLPMDDKPKGLIGLASQWEDSPKVRDAEFRADIVQAARALIALWKEQFPSLLLP